MAQWVDVCSADDVEIEAVTRFDHGGRTFAIYRSPTDTFHCTDGLCTHEKGYLAEPAAGKSVADERYGHLEMRKAHDVMLAVANVQNRCSDGILDQTTDHNLLIYNKKGSLAPKVERPKSREETPRKGCKLKTEALNSRSQYCIASHH